MADLASIDPGLIFELTPSDGDVMSIFTTTGIGDNKILYTNASNWCKHTSQNTGQFPDTTCITDTTSGTEIFAGPQNSYKRFVGIIDALGPVGLPSCDNNIKGFSPFPLCMYDKGRGMTINIGTKEVKSIYTPFVHSPFLEGISSITELEHLDI
ncbi:MAG UNVERIFIED_CONTAM: hypothetical protein LVR18_03605 [Planctomycetaceae bacterium]|jgi:hypothetical protein